MHRINSALTSTMGSSGSVLSGALADEAAKQLADEAAKPADGSDVVDDPLAEVARLRALIKEAAAVEPKAEGAEAGAEAGTGDGADAGAAPSGGDAAATETATETAEGETGDNTGSSAGWAIEYCINGTLDCKDIPTALPLFVEDARVQVVEEEEAPRFSMMALPTAPSEGVPAPPAALTTERLYWIAAFAKKDSWAGPHRARPSNQEFTKKFMPTCRFWPDDPESATPPEMMAAAAKSMAGTYMGPCWHLERSGASVDGTVYTVRVDLTCKSPEAALELIELTKAGKIKVRL